jgi:hypothetical protein
VRQAEQFPIALGDKSMHRLICIEEARAHVIRVISGESAEAPERP